MDFNMEASGWSIGEPDLIVQLDEPYLVADDVEDLYIDFEVQITEEQLPEDRWIKAVEFRAGSSAVHHVIASPIGGIAPGVEARVFPDGYGTVLRKGTSVTFNMLTREGASTRRNGIVVLDLTDPAHPTVLSELTDSLTAGIHNVWIMGDTEAFRPPADATRPGRRNGSV